MGKTVSEAIEYRRSVRKYLDTDLNQDKVKIVSKMQHLHATAVICNFGVYHITDKKVLSQLSKACLTKMQLKLQLIWLYLLQRDKWKIKQNKT